VRGVSHTVNRHVGVAVERLFDTVVAEDVLPTALHRWDPIPAVVGTRDHVHTAWARYMAQCADLAVALVLEDA
jgi:hypothetical protein